MTSSHAPKGPYKLVTVNTAPDRAKRVIGQLVEALRDDFEIVHAANCEKIEDVEAIVTKEQPDLLFCASMWTSEQATEIQTIAKAVKPNIATYAIPHGLKAQHGESALIDHLKSTVPNILEQHSQ